MDGTLAQLIRDLTLLSAECEARGKRIQELEAELAERTEQEPRVRRVAASAE